MLGQSTLGDEEDDELLHPEREAQPGRIARPNASSSLPGASLRGLPPPVPSASPSAPTGAAPAPGSTEDLENLAEASHLAPRPVAKPSALESRLSGDQSELVREQRTGSGISQIQHGSPEGGIGIAKPHPVLGGILRGLSTVGSVISPTIMSRIPGTEEHHDKLLTQQQGRIGEDLGEQKDQAVNEETQARTDQATAAAEKDRALAAEAGKVKPKEESWKDYPQFTDVDGTPLKIEANSGQTLRVDGKQPTGFKAAKPDQAFQTDKTVRIVDGVPHEILIDKQTGADVKDLGPTKLPGESPEAKRSAGESAQVEREARQNIRKAEGAFHDTQRTVSQLSQSIDAAKDGNGLLTSFVPTMEVLGINASNGVHRISPAEAQAAGMPGSFVERFNAFFDKASTGKLSPELQQEGKALAGILLDSAYARYKSTYDDENGIVSGYGGTGFDKRVPLIPHQANAAGGAEPIYATNPKTKERVMSKDGGATWQSAP